MRRVGMFLREVALCSLVALIVICCSGMADADELMDQQSARYVQEGIEVQRSGDIEYAISLYTKAIYANPDNVQAYNNLGTAYAQRGDIKKAEDMYEQAVAVDPYYSPALKNLAIIYADRGDYDTAFEYWKRASGMDIQSPFVIDDEE